MEDKSILQILDFLKKAENLKNTLRFAYTSNGRQESSADHSWRLALMAMLVAYDLKNLNMEKLLKLAIIHDLAEAICGDIPAINIDKQQNKAKNEKKAMEKLIESLPTKIKNELFVLWQEYEDAITLEAQFIKGLDKLETILQHNQGVNPADFNYNFNLNYGSEYTDKHERLQDIRTILDGWTKNNC